MEDTRRSAAAAVEAVFRLDLPHGRCVGVAVPDEAPGAALVVALDPEERAVLATMSASRQASFAAGRAALRAALTDLQLPLGPLLPDDRGGPRLPPGVLASISHKRHLAVALAAPARAGQGTSALGVDLEDLRPFRIDISRRVLRPEEQEVVAALPDPERALAVLTRFCLKEAFYKAANGFVGRMIAFQEVAVAAIADDGHAGFAGPFFEDHPLPADGWVGSPVPGYLIASVLVTARSC